MSALSDVGLFATAYGGILVVADCHTQDIVVRSGTGHADYFSRQLGAQDERLIKAEAHSEIMWLTFTVCRTAKGNANARCAWCGKQWKGRRHGRRWPPAFLVRCVPAAVDQPH